MIPTLAEEKLLNQEHMAAIPRTRPADFCAAYHLGNDVTEILRIFEVGSIFTLLLKDQAELQTWGFSLGAISEIRVTRLPTDYVSSLKANARTQREHVPGMDIIAKQHGMSRSTFNRRLECGTRLMSLCAASSPYILVLIAVANKQQDFSRSLDADTIALVTALRDVSRKPTPLMIVGGRLVNRLRIPLEYARHFLSGFSFCHQKPQGLRKPVVYESIPFHSLVHTDPLFESMTTNFAALPPRSRLWFTPTPPRNITNPEDLPAVHVIETPSPFTKTPSPVYETTTDEFTERPEKTRKIQTRLAVWTI
ncbi:hypothetical protein R3P38DRAFT_3196462 [Favolaschia claudopus]|uniref:Maturase n=1 Tax=Favolaschia claudopus TaxID=2862362 RepID=A0AAW0B7U3_9AGAR